MGSIFSSAVGFVSGFIFKPQRVGQAGPGTRGPTDCGASHPPNLGVESRDDLDSRRRRRQIHRRAGRGLGYALRGHLDRIGDPLEELLEFLRLETVQFDHDLRDPLQEARVGVGARRACDDVLLSFCCLMRSAAAFQSSVGRPSVIRNTSGFQSPF